MESLYKNKQWEVLARFFADQRWYQQRLALCNGCLDGYLADLEIAYQAAIDRAWQCLDTDERARALGNCFHYQLLEANTRKLAKTYIPELIGLALEKDFWSAQQVIKMAQLLDASDQGHLCAGILQTGKLSLEQQQSVMEMALRAAPDLIYGNDRSPLLSALIPYANKAQLQELLHLAVKHTYEETYNAQVLRDLVQYASADLQDQILQLATEFDDPGAQAIVMTTLLSYLKTDEQLAWLVHTLETASIVYDEFEEPGTWTTTPAEILTLLAPVLKGPLIEYAFAYLPSLPSSLERATVLCQLYPRLPLDLHTTGEELFWSMAQRALSEIRTYTDLARNERTEEEVLRPFKVLHLVLPFLPGYLRNSSLEIVLPLIRHLSRPALHARAMTILLQEYRSLALGEDMVGEVLRMLSVVPDFQIKLEILVQMSAHLVSKLPDALWLETRMLLSASASIGSYFNDLEKFLRDLLPLLNGEQKAEMTRIILAMPEEQGWQKKRLLALVAPHINEEQQLQVLRMLLRMLGRTFDWRDRFPYIHPVLPLISDDLLQEMLCPVTDRLYQIPEIELAIVHLASQLPASERSRLLARELEYAQQKTADWLKRDALRVMAPFLTDELVEKTLLWCSQLEHETMQAAVLSVLEPGVRKPLRMRVVEMALQLQQPPMRVYALTPYLRYLDISLLERIWLSLPRESISPAFLLAIVELLPEKYLGQILDMLQTMRDEKTRTEILRLMLPRLSPRDLQQLVRTVQQDYVTHHLRTALFLLAAAIPPELETALKNKAHLLLRDQQDRLKIWQVFQERFHLPPRASSDRGSDADIAPVDVRQSFLEQWDQAIRLADHWERTQTLAALLAETQIWKSALQVISSSLLMSLQAQRSRPRQELLRMFCVPGLFTLRLFDLETLNRLIQDIHTICREWTWEYDISFEQERDG